MIRTLDIAMLRQVRALARDRAPSGRAMGRFRWAVAPDGRIWHFPATAPARSGCAEPFGLVTTLPLGLRPGRRDPRGVALRLAIAVRQDLWRALSRVRGVCPVVAVALSEPGPDGQVEAEITMGGVLSPGHVAGRTSLAAALPAARERLARREVSWRRHAEGPRQPRRARSRAER